MKICSNKDIKVMAAVMASTILLGGCTATSKPAATQALKNDPEIKADINFNEVKNAGYDKEIMDEQYRRYCFDLLSQTVKDYGGEGNVMISPASIMLALDMVAAGAKDESLRQLTDLFAVGEGPLNQQAYAASIMDKINGAQKVDFSCANAVWSNRKLLGDAVNLEYIDYIKETFDAEYRIRDFDSKTPDEINSWVYEHTDHMIEKVISSLDPMTVMVLVNAISFDGKWEEPYEDNQVHEAEFTKWDGTTQKGDFLYGAETAYFESEKATGFMKAYEGGQYSFLAILPSDESVSANEFAKNFTSADYEKFIGSLTYEYDVYTGMPVFKSDFDITLNDTLKNLGAKNAFDPETADLSGIAGKPGDLYIAKVIHKTHIEVDANGTKAAAVTVVRVDGAGAIANPKEYRTVMCDRPFVYAIIDNETMAPIFIGTVNEI